MYLLPTTFDTIKRITKNKPGEIKHQSKSYEWYLEDEVTSTKLMRRGRTFRANCFFLESESFWQALVSTFAMQRYKDKGVELSDVLSLLSKSWAAPCSFVPLIN